VENTTFVNFRPNATRDAAALSYLMYTSFGMSTENAIEAREIRQRQAGRFPARSCADGPPISARQCLAGRGDP
jgi:hypothetical protein